MAKQKVIKQKLYKYQYAGAHEMRVEFDDLCSFESVYHNKGVTHTVHVRKQYPELYHDHFAFMIAIGGAFPNHHYDGDLDCQKECGKSHKEIRKEFDYLRSLCKKEEDFTVELIAVVEEEGGCCVIS